MKRSEKEVKNSYPENSKILMKEAEDNTNIDNTVLMDWLFYPRQSIDWMQSLSNNGIFHRFRKKNDTKMCMEWQ